MKKFQHGGDIKSFAKNLNCSFKDIIDLSSNINFIKPKIDIDFNKVDISYYPTYEKLYKSIAKKYSVKASEIELFNGGSSAIFKLFKNLNLNHCVIYSPAYLEYKKASEIFDYKLQKINRFKDFEKKDIPKNSFVVFVNPSTPDGRYYNLEKLMKYWISKDCTILIDESFLDFTNYQSALKYLKTYDKLYILKSMTKFYSCAGVRLGTLISNKKNIKKIKEKEPMWKLSSFDMSYIIEVLKNKKFAKESIKKNDKNRTLLKKVLEKSSLIKKVYHSDANFFLIKLKNIDAIAFQDILKGEKIYIRDCSNFDFLDSSFVRIAVKSKKSISFLEKVLKRFN